MEPAPLAADRLRRRTDPSTFAFETTATLDEPAEVVGQERAMEAVRFGIAIRRHGYNVFALGPTGVGKHDAVFRSLEERAATEPVPSDWCYLSNFADPHRPRALSLPAGRGSDFRRDMEKLIAELHLAIPAAFGSEDYRGRKRMLEEQHKQRQEQEFASIDSAARERSLALLKTPVGLAVAPARDGEVLEPDEFHRLPESEQERFRADMKLLQDRIQSTLATLPTWEREQREKLRALDQEVLQNAVGHLLGELRERYADLPAIVKHLEAVEQDLIENADQVLPRGDNPETPADRRGRAGETKPLRRYEVNLLVNHGASRGAPVIYEDYPTPTALLGRVEYQAEMGTLVTDFHFVKAGALHRANGGYLVVDARKVLQQPFAWEQLKRALRSGEARIESPVQSLGLFSTAMLEPESIPLDTKVVLVGDRQLYYLLSEWDPDFLELFKVAADFEDQLPRDADGELAFARLLGSLARREELLPLRREAVARSVEHGARLAADSERLSIHVESVADLLREADHWARSAGRSVIEAQDIDTAIDAQIRRSARVRERVQEEINRGTILIDTEGTAVGQVNGLSVLQIGRFAFGRPSRITARVRLGNGEVVDIEREVALGGPIHSKGVLILSGFLGARYAHAHPLSLKASLVFEQSYGGVEGDSASLAELIALLSAIAEIPVGQNLAVTGSINQRGEVQVIGGVNEKVEGFFDICLERGLTGNQGVLIPQSNVKHLMLREDVVVAAAEGRFRIWAVASVDEALTILTGVPAGEVQEGGGFPLGTFNQRVEARLAQFAERARAFARGPAETQATSR